MIKKLKSSEFVTSVATLVSGTIIAQAITYSLSPIISRLYTSEEMSYQSLFLRIVTFISILATARLELAFNLPKRNEHAFSLVRVSLKLLFITSIITLIGSLLMLLVPLADGNMYAVYLAVPFGVFVVSTFNQGNNLALREREFKRISIAKMVQSLGNSIGSIAFYGFGYLGAIIAYVVSLLLGSFIFVKQFDHARKHMRTFKLKGRDFAIAKAYSEFPRINLPHALVDVTKELVIAFYMIKTFEKEVLGLYDLSFRMLRIPVVMLGASIGQVFYKKAIDMKNENQSFYPLLIKTIRTLFLLSILPFGALMLFGEELFGFVFGENWAKAGYYSQIMAPWLLMNFLSSPVSMVPTILKKQQIFFYFGIASALLLIFSVAINSFFPSINWGFEQILWLVSASQFALHAVMLVWLIYITKKHA